MSKHVFSTFSIVLLSLQSLIYLIISQLIVNRNILECVDECLETLICKYYITCLSVLVFLLAQIIYLKGWCEKRTRQVNFKSQIIMWPPLFLIPDMFVNLCIVSTFYFLTSGFSTSFLTL